MGRKRINFNHIARSAPDAAQLMLHCKSVDVVCAGQDCGLYELERGA